MEKIDNIKKLVAEMDKKQEFVELVANDFSLSYIYVLQNWFQSRWRIPVDNLDRVIELAQKSLYLQNLRKQKVLKSTGFKVEDFKAKTEK